jgi:DNA-binding response OmpR family regulator
MTPSTRASPASILIVEDEWLIAEQLASALRSSGCRVIGPVPSVDRARALIERERPSVALLDVNVRDGKCFPIADALRKSRTPFGFLTGFNEPDLPEDYRTVPRLTKPIDTSKLGAFVDSLLV